MSMKESGLMGFDWGEVLTGEFLLFGLLGKILYTYPEESWLKSLFDDEMFVESPFTGEQADVIAGLKLLEKTAEEYQRGTDDIITDLKVDYTRLFDHTERIPVAPWESVYLSKDHLLFQQQVLEVRSWFNSYGLEIINLHKEPEDHVGLELAFLAHLANLGLSAMGEGNESRLEELLDAQRRFLSEHPLKWVPNWCDLMVRYAHTDFYRGVALILRGSLMEIAEILDLEIPEELAE
ncbi:MAG: molecular chaperone TorD family protein [Chloroflexota bacterium]